MYGSNLLVSGVAHQGSRMLSEQRLRLDAKPAQGPLRSRSGCGDRSATYRDQRGKRIGDQPQLALAGEQTLGQVSNTSRPGAPSTITYCSSAASGAASSYGLMKRLTVGVDIRGPPRGQGIHERLHQARHAGRHRAHRAAALAPDRLGTALQQQDLAVVDGPLEVLRRSVVLLGALGQLGDLPRLGPS